MRPLLLIALTLAPLASASVGSNPLRASTDPLVFGKPLVLFGQFANRLSDQTVILQAKEFGDPAYTTVSVATTKAGGRWRLVVSPTIQTTYQASTVSERSAPLDIHLRPHVSLKPRGRGFVLRVVSTASYEGRFVLIQRRVSKRWHEVGRVVVSKTPRGFNIALPKGTSRLRAYLPRSQAGAGYVAGVSTPIVVTR